MARPYNDHNACPQYVAPDEPVHYTRAQRAANWLHYNKWYVVAAAAALALVFTFLKTTVFSPVPDLQVSIVSAAQLPGELLEHLPEQLETLASDENGDGHVLVRVDQYIMNFGEGVGMTDVYAEFAGEALLNTDLETSQSMIFLTDAPEQLQAWCREIYTEDSVFSVDLSAGGEPVPWTESAGAELDLGTFYRTDGTEHPGQEAMAPLYLLRRAETEPGKPGGLSLWTALTGRS